MFQTFFYQPILNLLVFLYNIIPGHDFGLAIIGLTIIVKLALLPISKKSIEAQKQLQSLQPEIDEIKKKYADNKEEQSRKMMEVYKKNNTNPFSSCLLLLIQLPFLIAVFQVFRAGLANGSLDLVYPFIFRPESINTVSFGFLQLADPNAVLAVLAGLAQFFQAKMMLAKKPAVKKTGAGDENMAAIMSSQMTYFMPILTVFIALQLPGGLALYWLTITLLTILQQFWVMKKKETVCEAS